MEGGYQEYRQEKIREECEEKRIFENEQEVYYKDLYKSLQSVTRFNDTIKQINVESNHLSTWQSML